MHKEPKVILRVYVTPDERDALKQIAEEQNSSLSELIATATRKQYKLGKKKKVRQVNASLLEDTEIANEQPSDLPPEVSSNGQLDAGLNDLPLDDEKQPLDVVSSSATVPTVADVPPEESETLSVDVESGIAPEEDTDNQEITTPDDEDSTYKYFDDLLSKGSEPHLFTNDEKDAMRKRITYIKKKINTAQKTGNHLPRAEYAKLAEQKKRLIAIVYPNNNNQ